MFITDENFWDQHFILKHLLMYKLPIEVLRIIMRRLRLS